MVGHPAFKIKAGCFVAGTLVQTKEGFRPIEQIEVGDLMLSKSEGGMGEPSYQPVTRTLRYESQEIYLVTWQVMDGKIPTKVRGNLVATGAHPIWVQRIVEDAWSDGDHSEMVTEVNGWVSIEEIYFRRWKTYWEGCGWVTTYVELADGRIATLQFINPVLQSDDPDVGVGFSDREDWRDDPGGTEIRFEQHGPRISYDDDGLLPTNKWLPFNYEIDYDYTGYDTESPMSVVKRSHGYLPMRRTVFNLEVANTHNYFVTEMGLWVRDASEVDTKQSPD